MDKIEKNTHSVTLKKKVEFLSNPETYTTPPEEVVTKETHMSWVFLTDAHAYKLKKPVQYSFLDFSTVEARYKDCKEEVRLNRRLAEEVYLGIVPLTLDGWGQLHLGKEGEGEVIDWLVKMRRLPEVLMLDYLMQYHLIPDEELRQSAELLARFYQRQQPVAIDPADYCTSLEEKLHHYFHELTSFDLPYPLHHEILARQQQFLSDHSQLFEKRVRWVLEAHGDLRPEHICLQLPPVIIDCLEFNPALRTLDVADELSFFSLECEVRESPKVAEIFWEVHREVNGDVVPLQLIDFYKSYRAVLRALLAMRHTLEESYRHDHKYQQQAQQYLQLAEKYVQNL